MASKLRLFRVTYTDDGPDMGCPDFTLTLRAYDREHAEEKFFDAGDDDGWRIVRIECVK